MPNDQKFHAECEFGQTALAVREPDYHDTFLAADYSHPGDSIPAVLAVAQQLGKSGKDLLRGIVASYEVHVNLVKAICLHEHKIDHVAHLCPAQAAGVCAFIRIRCRNYLPSYPTSITRFNLYKTIKKGRNLFLEGICTAHGAKLAIEAVDRAMRGEGAPLN